MSALGVGEDFNENLMQGMADQGGGFSGFLNSSQLAEVFTRELEQATGTVARCGGAAADAARAGDERRR